MSHTRGECEAIRLLREILEHEDGRAHAMEAGRRLLKSLRLPPGALAQGRKCSRVSQAQLREIARLDAEGLTDTQIHRETGVPRYLVRHHRAGSSAMLDALLEVGS